MSGDHANTEDLEKLNVNDEIDSTYRPPPEKSLDELVNADKDDQSLQKYKEKLLGEATSAKIIIGEWEVHKNDRVRRSRSVFYPLSLYFGIGHPVIWDNSNRTWIVENRCYRSI